MVGQSIEPYQVCQREHTTNKCVNTKFKDIEMMHDLKLGWISLGMIKGCVFKISLSILLPLIMGFTFI